MKQTKQIMGIPIAIEIINGTAEQFKKAYDYFRYVDKKFSTYKETSEITQINRGEKEQKDFSRDMKTIFELSEKTKNETHGYFDIHHNGMYDPSGIVKGWAIYNAAQLLKKLGASNFFIDAGGDIQVHGKNSLGKKWKIGIRNPFNELEIIKVLEIEEKGVATSGTYNRGHHIYNPVSTNDSLHEIVSLTVIGPNIYEADRFATAAFAMGRKGIELISNLNGFEGYMIDKNGMATFTQHFKNYTA